MRGALDAVTFGRRRRARAMHRRLAELDRIEFGVEPVPRRRPRPAASAFVVVLLLVVGGVVVWESTGDEGGVGQGLTASGGAFGSSKPQAIVGAPTTTFLASPRRLLPPAKSVSAPAGSYRYLPDHGARWEPCRPIHYVVRRGGEGRRLDDIVTSSVAEVSAATGLKFVADGSTTELPTYSMSSRLSYIPSLYGDRWAPVLIAWSNTSENPSLANAEGRAGPVTWGGPGEPARYVSGAVSFDTPKMRVLMRGPLGAQYAREVVLHELGHLIGLAHVADKTEVMHPGYPKPPVTHYALGDRAGLAVLGNGPCFTDY